MIDWNAYKAFVDECEAAAKSGREWHVEVKDDVSDGFWSFPLEVCGPEDGTVYRVVYDSPAVPTEIERLRAIAAKLPRTADGVTITPRSHVWLAPDDGIDRQRYVMSVSARHVQLGEDSEWIQGSELYSTCEAAKRAEQS